VVDAQLFPRNIPALCAAKLLLPATNQIPERCPQTDSRKKLCWIGKTHRVRNESKKAKGKNTTSPHLPQPPPGLGPIVPPTTQTTRTRTYIITPNWAHYVPSLNARLQGCVANLQIKSLHVISYLVHMKIDGTWDILLVSGEVSRW
jgi:hypothetical protein